MKPRHSQRGVTLVELVISITLVAAITTGMLMAMRTSLETLQKTQGRLEENRRTMGVQQLILRQVGGVIPVPGGCRLTGAPTSLRFVSTYSMTQGSRGYPQLVEYAVLPEPGGTVRLVFSEQIYPGSQCVPRPPLPQQVIVLAERLAFCRFFFRELIPEALEQGNWAASWNRPNLPASVRIEMAPFDPNPTKLPMLSLHIPLHISREVLGIYADTQ